MDLEEKVKNKTDYEPPDGCWAWVVLVSGVFVNLSCGAFAYTASILYLDHEREFGSSKSETSMVSSLFSFFNSCVPPLTSIISKYIGIRTTFMIGSFVCAAGFFLGAFAGNIYVLYLTAGALAGVGVGLFEPLNAIVITYYFRKRSTLAYGFFCSTTGIGIIIQSYTMLYVLDFYGWRGTLIISSGLALQGLICGATFWPLPIESSIRKQGYKIDYTLFKDTQFLALLLAEVFWIVGSSMPWIIIRVLAKECCITDARVSDITTAIGCGYIFGGISFMLTGVPKTFNHFAGMSVASFICGITIFCFNITCNYQLLIFIGLVYGIAMGYMYPGIYALSLKVVKINRMNTAWGILYLCDGIGYLLGPPLAGLVFDKTNSYFGAVVLGAAALMTVAIIYLSLAVYRRCIKEKSKI